jgi:HSF-type DNA-binding
MRSHLDSGAGIDGYGMLYVYTFDISIPSHCLVYSDSWFRQTKYASFQRQLNLYGFTRITKGRDANAYYQKYFLRGQYELTLRIPRTAIKGTGTRRSSSKKAEPDFYNMPYQMENVTPTTSTSTATDKAGPAIGVPSFHLRMSQPPHTTFHRNEIDRNVRGIHVEHANILDTHLVYPNTLDHMARLQHGPDLLPNQGFPLPMMGIPSAASSLLGTSSGTFPGLYEESHGTIGMTPRVLEAGGQNLWSNFVADRVAIMPVPTFPDVHSLATMQLDAYHGSSTAATLATIIDEQQVRVSEAINRRLVTGTSNIIDHVRHLLRGDHRI